MIAPDLGPLGPTNLHPRWRKLGWSTFARVILSAAAAFGGRLGDRLADLFLGGTEDDVEEMPEVKEDDDDSGTT